MVTFCSLIANVNFSRKYIVIELLLPTGLNPTRTYIAIFANYQVVVLFYTPPSQGKLTSLSRCLSVEVVFQQGPLYFQMKEFRYNSDFIRLTARRKNNM